MTHSIENIILILYFAILIILSLYGLHRYHLIYLYYKYKRKVPRPAGHFTELPPVTIQLPIFNELYVVERLIDAVCQIEYPRDRLQIQVLDDSTDETVEICQQKVQEYRRRGINIEYHHRDNRRGFKAGALEEGLRRATGEFIAIFDADFVPPRDFLMRTIHYFTDPQVGMVQARWGHLNRSYSLMTQAQSILLDGHFILEHAARNKSGRFFNFNGTAGIWRRRTIPDAGGWSHDTLTEDLDLSFRAQLKGWKFIFLQDLVAPAELPVEINAFKSQQHRWAKGSIQTGLKLLKTIWCSKVPLKVKIEATIHLTSNIAYLLMALLCLLMFPALIYRAHAGLYGLLLIDMPLFLAATISVASFYSVSQKEIFQRWWGRLKYLPFVTSLGIGLCVNNTKAVLEALLGYRSGFVRTPKYNVRDQIKSHRYQVRRNILPLIELSLAAYFVMAIYAAWTGRLYATIPFLLLFLFGFSYVGGLSLWQDLKMARALHVHIDQGEEELGGVATKSQKSQIGKI